MYMYMQFSTNRNDYFQRLSGTKIVGPCLRHCTDGYLVSNKPHDSDPCENVLPADRLLGNVVAVGRGLRVVRLTKVTHEYVHVCTERNSYGISTGSPQIMDKKALSERCT